MNSRFRGGFLLVALVLPGVTGCGAADTDAEARGSAAVSLDPGQASTPSAWQRAMEYTPEDGGWDEYVAAVEKECAGNNFELTIRVASFDASDDQDWDLVPTRTGIRYACPDRLPEFDRTAIRLGFGDRLD